MNIRRFLQIMVMALITLALGAPSVAASSSDEGGVKDSHIVSPSSFGYACTHMTIRKARSVFRHLDGTKSAASEWKVKYGFAIYHKGPMVRGIVPANFIGYAANPVYFLNLEGAKVKARSFEVWCVKDMGTYHTDTPPRGYPRSAEDAVDQFGGELEGWRYSKYAYGVDLDYYSDDKPLGAFTVPFQCYFETPEGTYTPGDEVPGGVRVNNKLACLFGGR